MEFTIHTTIVQQQCYYERTDLNENSYPSKMTRLTGKSTKNAYMYFVLLKKRGKNTFISKGEKAVQ